MGKRCFFCRTHGVSPTCNWRNCAKHTPVGNTNGTLRKWNELGWCECPQRIEQCGGSSGPGFRAAKISLFFWEKLEINKERCLEFQSGHGADGRSERTNLGIFQLRKINSRLKRRECQLLDWIGHLGGLVIQNGTDDTKLGPITQNPIQSDQPFSLIIRIPLCLPIQHCRADSPAPGTERLPSEWVWMDGWMGGCVFFLLSREDRLWAAPLRRASFCSRLPGKFGVPRFPGEGRENGKNIQPADF